MAMYYASSPKGVAVPTTQVLRSLARADAILWVAFLSGLFLFVILPQLLRREGEAMRDEGCDDVYYQRQ